MQPQSLGPLGWSVGPSEARSVARPAAPGLARVCLCVFPCSTVPGRRQNTIVVKVPGQEDSHNEDGESGSEASDSVSNCGQASSQSIGNNVTLITLNSEGNAGLPTAPHPAATFVPSPHCEVGVHPAGTPTCALCCGRASGWLPGPG